jgi:hypothetical protein
MGVGVLLQLFKAFNCDAVLKVEKSGSVDAKMVHKGMQHLRRHCT